MKLKLMKQRITPHNNNIQWVLNSMIQTYVPDNWYTELRVRSINPGRVT